MGCPLMQAVQLAIHVQPAEDERLRKKNYNLSKICVSLPLSLWLGEEVGDQDTLLEAPACCIVQMKANADEEQILVLYNLQNWNS